MIGWMYAVTLALFTISKGRWYYMGPAYPMLYAAGAVWGEQWLAAMQRARGAREMLPLIAGQIVQIETGVRADDERRLARDRTIDNRGGMVVG